MEFKDRFNVIFGSEVFDLHDREQRIDFGKKKWKGMIHREALKNKNCVCGYEDFTQEAMLIIIVAADRWTPERGGFASFLYECLKNGLIDVSTRTKYAVSVPSGSIHLNGNEGKTKRLTEDVPDKRYNVYEEIDICDTIENFDHFRVGKMYFVEKRTLEEISKITGISPSRIHRMINEMRRLIKSRLIV